MFFLLRTRPGLLHAEDGIILITSFFLETILTEHQFNSFQNTNNSVMLMLMPSVCPFDAADWSTKKPCSPTQDNKRTTVLIVYL